MARIEHALAGDTDQQPRFGNLIQHTTIVNADRTIASRVPVSEQATTSPALCSHKQRILSSVTGIAGLALKAPTARVFTRHVRQSIANQSLNEYVDHHDFSGNVFQQAVSELIFLVVWCWWSNYITGSIFFNPGDFSQRALRRCGWLLRNQVQQQINLRLQAETRPRGERQPRTGRHLTRVLLGHKRAWRRSMAISSKPTSGQQKLTMSRNFLILFVYGKPGARQKAHTKRVRMESGVRRRCLIILRI